MQDVKNGISLIKYNFKSFILFEFIYKILTFFFCCPIIFSIYKSLFIKYDFKIVSFENILIFIKNPLVLFFTILVLLLLIVLVLFDCTSLSVIYNASYNRKKIDLINIFKSSWNKFKLFFKKNNLLIWIFSFIYIPLLFFGLIIGFLITVPLPKFVNIYLFHNQNPIYIYYIFSGITLLLVSKFIFTLNYFIDDEESFSKSFKYSNILSKKHYFTNVISFVFIQSFIMLVSFLLIFFIVTLLYFFKVDYFIYLLILFIILLLFNIPFVISIITSLYYRRKEIRGEKINHITVSYYALGKKVKMYIVLVMLFILSFTIFAIYIISCRKNPSKFISEMSINTSVTAHRGASSAYPENTMAAFIGASELGADWIELDVHQTKDNKIVVSHDNSIKRITGIKNKISDMTYNEIKELDVGSYFSPDFVGEKMPLLEDAIKFAKSKKLKVNIELKPNLKDKSLEKSTISIVRRLKYLDNVVFASLDYSCLEKVKKIDKSLKTLYVTTLLKEPLDSYKYADDFSVELLGVNYDLVKSIHELNKKVFVWTIDDEETMRYYYSLGVDGIITDDVELAKKVLMKEERYSLIETYLSKLDNLLN